MTNEQFRSLLNSGENLILVNADGRKILPCKDHTACFLGKFTWIGQGQLALKEPNEFRDPSLTIIAIYKCTKSFSRQLDPMEHKDPTYNHWIGPLIWEYLPESKEEVDKVYIAHPISNDYEAKASIELAQTLRDMGYKVYAAAENKIINDKAANEPPTPAMIYQHDVNAIVDCDIFIVNLTGGHQDGTIMEVGVVAGINELLAEGNHIKVMAYTSNKRVQNPQHFEGIPSASINHLVLGAVDRWGKVYPSLNDLLKELQ